MNDNKWNDFLKSGSVSDYLKYRAEQKTLIKDDKKGENSNSWTDNKGN